MKKSIIVQIDDNILNDQKTWLIYETMYIFLNCSLKMPTENEFFEEKNCRKVLMNYFIRFSVKKIVYEKNH